MRLKEAKASQPARRTRRAVVARDRLHSVPAVLHSTSPVSAWRVKTI